MSIYDRIPKSTIPEGKSGQLEVIKFSVTKEQCDEFNFRLLLQHSHTPDIASALQLSPGDYTKLIERDIDDPKRGSMWMSDTPAEIRSHLTFWHCAAGYVLINGLGLGLIARAVLLKGNVSLVVVNETNEDILKLVAPHLEKEFGNRIQINQEDAFEYKPNGLRFNAIWHDIWPTISPTNYEQMKKLHRRYGRWLDDPSCDCFNSSWQVGLVKKAYKEDKQWQSF